MVCERRLHSQDLAVHLEIQDEDATNGVLDFVCGCSDPSELLEEHLRRILEQADSIDEVALASLGPCLDALENIPLFDDRILVALLDIGDRVVQLGLVNHVHVPKELKQN
jgi:hypothetical protein